MLRFFRQGLKDDSDEELLNRYRKTDNQEWLGQLYGRYLELVYGVCLKYLQDEASAEDAVMAIFEELMTKVREHDIQNFRSWLYVLSKNHCLMKLRKDKRRQTVNYDPGIMHSIDPAHHTMEDFEENGEAAMLRDCIQRLSEQQKQCIELFYFQEYSYKEIAEMRSERLGQVRSNIQNGRRNLRLCMEKKIGRER
jgi:RNA polymerase sigma factor (sigma-70 family)